jgi:FkbM family methyltransferase
VHLSGRLVRSLAYSLLFTGGQFQNIRAVIAHPRFFRLVSPMLERLSFDFRLSTTLIGNSGTVFVVGANTGGDVLRYANLVGRQGRVDAFEPVPYTFEHLRRKVEYSGLRDRVKLSRYAVADAAGTSTIRMPGSNSSQASLTVHTIASWAHAEVREFPCRVTTLDEYSSQQGITKVDLVTIDVEGGELLVLKGMTRLLRSEPPPILILEIVPAWIRDFGYSFQELFAFLHDSGYECYFIEKSRLVKCKRADDIPSMIEFPHNVDFVWLPRGNMEKRLLNALGQVAD